MRRIVNEKLEIRSVLYKTPNVLLIGGERWSGKKSKTAFIICEGTSMSLNSGNTPQQWDPFLTIPNEEEYSYLDGDVINMYFPFECDGLQKAGEDLATYINVYMRDYETIAIIGHSKAGVCIANMARMLAKKIVLVFVSAPFNGTIMADPERVGIRVNKLENTFYKKFYKMHPVDLDVIPNSHFLRIANFSGIKSHICINVIAKCNRPLTMTDLFYQYVGSRIGYRESDGIVTVSSQKMISLKFPTVDTLYLNASHANSLKRYMSIHREKYIIE